MYDFDILSLPPTSSVWKILMQIKPGSKILECGCATGYMTKYMTEELHCKVYIVEYDEEAFSVAKQYAEDGICGDLMQLEWVEKFNQIIFDYIVFADVLEHLYDPQKVLANAIKLLGDNGTVLASIPNIAHNDIILKLIQDRWDYTKRGLLDKTHIHFWAKNNIVPFFHSAGLDVSILDCSTCLSLQTEQNWENQIVADRSSMQLLQNHLCGEIYQFIVTAQKKRSNQYDATLLDLTIVSRPTLTTSENKRDAKSEDVSVQKSDFKVSEMIASGNCNNDEKWNDVKREYEKKCEEYEKKCSEYISSLLLARKEVREKEATLNQIQTSRFYRVATRYYKIRDWLLPQRSQRRAFLKRLVTLFRKDSIQAPSNPMFAESQPLDFSECQRIDILTPLHTVYLAKLIRKHLNEADIACNIHVGPIEDYLNIPYIILCPQNFQKFPPLYIVYQMEQTINPRWFSEQYYQILQNAYAILDYSLVNISFFSRNSDLISKVFYVPIDYLNGLSVEGRNQKKSYDVLFYGDAQNPRRQAILLKLSEQFRVKICSEMFGEDVYQEIRKSKVVVNLHYYENALLETTRLYEALSLNSSIVISERSTDKAEDNRLQNIVDFVDVGDCESLINRIYYWLTNDNLRDEKIAQNQALLQKRSSAFSFYFYRFLLAHDRLSFDQFYKRANQYIHFEGDRICLSLPESTARREVFDNDNKYGFEVFPALKHNLGWIGCGLSYKFIMRKAIEQQLSQIIICEDDVFFPCDFSSRFERVLSYLNKSNDWDVFCGIMADVGKVSIKKCDFSQGERLVYLDRMISMVFNIYKPSMYSYISDWDELNHDVNANTIDRYLESKSLSVVCTSPFLTGHKEELDSTIWGFSNNQYSDLIAKSNQKIEMLVNDYYQKTCE